MPWSWGLPARVGWWSWGSGGWVGCSMGSVPVMSWPFKLGVSCGVMRPDWRAGWSWVVNGAAAPVPRVRARIRAIESGPVAAVRRCEVPGVPMPLKEVASRSPARLDLKEPT